MTTHTCASCDEPAPDGLTICRRCENQTRFNLADQASHYEDLVTAMSRMVRLNGPSDGGRGADRNLGWAAMGPRFLEDITPEEVRQIAAALPPARVAADALHSQRSLLVSWCRLLVEEGMARRYPADTIPAMACFIEAHLKELRKHECAGELVTELKALNRQIMKAVDVPAHRQKVHVGPCPQVLDIGGAQVDCEGQVYALFPRDEEERPVMRCGMCRAEWTAEHWNRVGELITRRKSA